MLPTSCCSRASTTRSKAPISPRTPCSRKLFDLSTLSSCVARLYLTAPANYDARHSASSIISASSSTESTGERSAQAEQQRVVAASPFVMPVRCSKWTPIFSPNVRGVGRQACTSSMTWFQTLISCSLYVLKLAA